jgi:antitoxin component HigA of HigAB toxin-antitoxin module
MDIRPLHTDDDYRAALAELSALVDQDPEPGTPEGDRLEVLSILAEYYEGGLMATEHLLRSPTNVDHWERSIDQLRSGNHRDDRAPESSSNYRVMEFSEGEERWQAIHEVHYREGVPASYSEQPASVQWDAEDSNDTGHGILDRMRDSLNKPVLRPEDFA